MHDETKSSSDSQTCSEPEESESLVKRLCTRHQEGLALVPVDISYVNISNSLMATTPSIEAYFDKTELSSNSQICSVPEDSEPVMNWLCRRRKQQKCPEDEQSQTCDKVEIVESTQLNVGNEQSNINPVSPLKRLRRRCPEPYSPRTSPVMEENESSRPYLCHKRAKSSSLSFQEKEKTSVTPQVALISERGTGIEPLAKLNVDPYMDHTPVENVLEMYRNNSLDLPRDEPYTDDQLQNEVPLAMILPGTPVSCYFNNNFKNKFQAC